MDEVVYFSTRSGNTHSFVTRLGRPARRIPLRAGEAIIAEKPFVLIVPTYAGEGGRGAVPRPMILFLNDAENRARLRGVIAAGNRNFGETFALAGDIIPPSASCRIFLGLSSLAPRKTSQMSETDWNDFGDAHTRTTRQDGGSRARVSCAECHARPHHG